MLISSLVFLSSVQTSTFLNKISSLKLLPHANQSIGLLHEKSRGKHHNNIVNAPIYYLLRRFAI
jgi:hypothetical protein